MTLNFSVFFNVFYSFTIFRYKTIVIMIALQYNNYRLSITKCKKIIIVNYEFGGSIEMKVNLPEKNFFDSFYIWFNKEKRE